MKKSANKYATFPAFCKSAGVPIPIAEYQFAKESHGRKWRMDWSWPQYRVAIEIEGAVWTGGRHTRGSGFVKDMEKYSTAASMGWLIVRCVPNDLFTGKTIDFIKGAISNSAFGHSTFYIPSNT